MVLSDWLMGNAANGSTSLWLGETTLLLSRDTMSELYYSIISANSSEGKKVLLERRRKKKWIVRCNFEKLGKGCEDLKF